MSTTLNEWLKKTIAELEEVRDAVPGAVNEDAAMALAAMKLALASLEAEPVCVIDQANLDYLKSDSDADVWPASRIEMGDVLLYRSAPPVPVSVPDAMEMDDDFDSSFEHGKAVGWNACRATMLQSFGNPEQLEPVTTAYKLPFEQWLSQQTGTIDVECGCVMTEVFFHWLRVAYEAGNSPVIPDGWVLVPVDPTMAMLDEFDSIIDHGAEDSKDAWSRLLAAAPQQEVNP
ncbi:hypothetical protein SNU49_000104 [Escherichia coli]|nr:hypothetical protein [Escherichia coli]HAH8713526.1 hypothetical protein [Escherichia coli]HAH9349914.1 hypothetical protein [Escherichia coli]